MHVVTLPEEIVIDAEQTIKPGEYLCEDITGAQLINLCGAGKMTPLVESRPFDDNADWNGESVVIVRVGGFGDLTNLTPALREMKRRWPRVVLTVATMRDYGDVMKGLPYVDHIVRYPLTKAEHAKYDAWVFLENAIENNPRAEDIPMADVFAEIIGIAHPKKAWLKGSKDDVSEWTPKTSDRKPEYRVSDDEAAWAKVQYPRIPNVRRLCIQVDASMSGLCRVYPMQQLATIVEAFQKETAWEVYLIGRRENLERVPDGPNVRNLSSHGLSFRKTAAVIQGASCFLGSDSAFIHIAGALDVPSVGLFGPFPWALRTVYSPSVFGIQGRGKCSPCFFHEKGGSAVRAKFPKNCPSREQGLCEVLAGIKPETVIAKVKKLARE
jgi:ADP-heptose:LPS heptosyltransferase